MILSAIYISDVHIFNFTGTHECFQNAVP